MKGMSMMRSTYRNLQGPLGSLKDHLRAPSSIYDHTNTLGHHTKLDNFSIVGREVHTLARTTKNTMYIRSMVYASAGILESASCPMHGIRSCSTPLISTSKRPSLQSQQIQLHKTNNTRPQGNVRPTHCVYNLNTW